MDSKWSDSLICSVCSRSYEDPITLPCLHSFCRKCIGSFSNRYEQISCPVCGETIECAEKRSTNFFLKNYVDLYSTCKEKEKSCSFCILIGKNADVVSQCLTCGDCLCSACVERHKNTTQTYKHKVVPFVDVIAGVHNETIRSLQHIPCFKHDNEHIKYICKSCDVPVCSECLIFEHRKHDCELSSEARKRNEENFNVLMTSSEERLKILHTAQKTVRHEVKKLEKDKDMLSERIDKAVKQRPDNATDFKIKAERKLEAIVQFHREKLALIEKELELLKESYSFCKNVTEYGSDMEVFTLQKDMIKRLSKLKLTQKAEDKNYKEVNLPVFEVISDVDCCRMVLRQNSDILLTSHYIQWNRNHPGIPTERDDDRYVNTFNQFFSIVMWCVCLYLVHKLDKLLR